MDLIRYDKDDGSFEHYHDDEYYWSYWETDFIGENLFDDWFDADFPQWPEFRDLDRAERRLYGRHADRLMKTDVHEHEDHYEVDIDLPGFSKEEISLELNNGYLTVSLSGCLP